MAIKIYPKNIYDIKYDKIIDNYVDKIYAQPNKVTPTYQKNEQFFVNAVDVQSFYDYSNLKTAYDSKFSEQYSSQGTIKKLNGTYLYYKAKYAHIKNLYVPKLVGNTENIINLANTVATVTYKKTTGKGSINADIIDTVIEPGKWSMKDPQYRPEVTEKFLPDFIKSQNYAEMQNDGASLFPIVHNNNIIYTETLPTVSGSEDTITIQVPFTNLTNFTSNQIEEVPGENKYLIKNITFYIGYELFELSGSANGFRDETPSSILLTGGYTEVNAERVEFTYSADQNDLKFEKQNIIFGTGEYAYKAKSNELLQCNFEDEKIVLDKSYSQSEKFRMDFTPILRAPAIAQKTETFTVPFPGIIDNVVVIQDDGTNVTYKKVNDNTVKVTVKLPPGIMFGVYDIEININYHIDSDLKRDYNALLQKYKNGKEIITLKCDIKDYYDESGEKIIDVSKKNRMTFHLYDEVIPYKSVNKMNFDEYKVVEVPLSSNLDGTPKKFFVAGTKMIFDGAVWQELQLIEI